MADGLEGGHSRQKSGQDQESDDLEYHNPGAMDEILEAPLDDPLFDCPPAYPSSTDGGNGELQNDSGPSNWASDPERPTTPVNPHLSPGLRSPRIRVENDMNDSLEMMGGDLMDNMDFCGDLDPLGGVNANGEQTSPTTNSHRNSPSDNPERASSKEEKVKQARKKGVRKRRHHLIVDKRTDILIATKELRQWQMDTRALVIRRPKKARRSLLCSDLRAGKEWLNLMDAGDRPPAGLQALLAELDEPHDSARCHNLDLEGGEGHEQHAEPERGTPEGRGYPGNDVGDLFYAQDEGPLMEENEVNINTDFDMGGHTPGRASDPTAWGISDYADPTSTFDGGQEMAGEHGADPPAEYMDTAQGARKASAPQNSNDILFERLRAALDTPAGGATHIPAQRKWASGSDHHNQGKRKADEAGLDSIQKPESDTSHSSRRSRRLSGYESGGQGWAWDPEELLPAVPEGSGLPSDKAQPDQPSPQRTPYHAGGLTQFQAMEGSGLWVETEAQMTAEEKGAPVDQSTFATLTVLKGNARVAGQQEGKNVVSFASVSKGLEKMHAAKLFYQICVSHKEGLIRATQEEAYGDILIET